MCPCSGDFCEQLIEDSVFLKAEWRLDTEVVDKLILQLNRVYPQILTDKEATKVSLQDAKIFTSKFFKPGKKHFTFKNTLRLLLDLSAKPFL